jgi:phage terminase large subunit GpA-like protein
VKDTADEAAWAALDELLARTYGTATGVTMAIRWMAVDSGYNTNQVYTWARRHPGRVLATKGVSGAKALLGSPTPVEVTVSGRKIKRGCKVWPVGVDVAKAELYGWLRLTRGAGGQCPTGYCHFPEYGEDYFKQLTAEQLVTVKNDRGYFVQEWQMLRENHYLDARVYARAAMVLGESVLRRPATPTAPPAENPQGGSADSSKRGMTRPR